MAITKLNPVASANFLTAGDLSIVTAVKGVQSLDLRTFTLYQQNNQPSGNNWSAVSQIVLPTTDYLPEGTINKYGATKFTQLTDVPNSYAGQSLKNVRVNALETGLEFFTPSGTGITSLNGLNAAVQTFSKVDDTNMLLTITSAVANHQFTLAWVGTLADGRIASAATWNAKQDAISLTTTGTSGVATFAGNVLNIPNYGAGSGTVTSVSVVSANGFAGTVATATTTPAITLTTTITGVLKGNGTAISAATDSDITGKLLTGYVSGAGTVAATDSILQAIEKLNGNATTLYVPYTGATADVLLGTHYINPKYVLLTDQAVPAAPSATNLILQSISDKGFSIPHVFDTQGNDIEITRDSLLVVFNNSGVIINRGEAVYVSGSTGLAATVAKAKADSVSTMPAIGVMYDTTANNAFGRVLLLGDLENYDLSAFSNGDLLYVSSATAGALTNTSPSVPNISQFMGTVISNSAVVGVLNVQTGTRAESASAIVGGAALTKTDDTNVTLTLGGSPAAALLAATSLTLGWTGTLGTSRGGLNVDSSAWAQGDIPYISATGTWNHLVKDTNATRYLSNTGTTNNPAWAQVDLTNGVSGDLPFANLTQGLARSVLGVTGNATADVASIQGTTDQVLVVNSAGTALSFGTVATNGITNNAVTYAKMQAVSTTSKLLGSSSTTTAVQEITIGTGLSLSGTTLTASAGSGANTALSNLASVAINTSLLPASDDAIDLGDDTHRFHSLRLKLASGFIGWGTGGGDGAIEATGTAGSATLTFTNAVSGYSFDNVIFPSVANVNLGITSTNPFGSVFLGSAKKIDFNNGDYTLTHSAGILTANKDLRVTTAGTNTASVATLGATQTFTNKDNTNCTANTQALNDNSTKIATTAYVDRGARTRGTISTAFETAGRFTSDASSGTATFGTTGVTLTTTSTTTRYIRLRLVAPVANFKAFANSPTFWASFSMSAVGTTGSYYIGIGAVTAAGTGHTYTVSHIGFKITVASSTASLIATQADGTTENASAALTTLTAGDYVEVYAVVNGTTSVDYYWKKNESALSSATNLTSNLPTATSDTPMSFSVSNNTTATTQTFVMNACSYSR